MCNKEVDNYYHAIECAPDRYKTQRNVWWAINTHPPTIQFIQLVPE